MLQQIERVSNWSPFEARRLLHNCFLDSLLRMATELNHFIKRRLRNGKGEGRGVQPSLKSTN